jgi:hypothetical protein
MGMRRYLLVDEYGQRHFTIKGSNAGWREISTYTPWPNADFHTDTSFEINRKFTPTRKRYNDKLIKMKTAPSCSLLMMGQILK